MATVTMASAGRLLVLYFVMMLLVQVYVEGAETGASTAQLQGDGMGIDCSAACGVRCQKASRHKMCLRACGTCCARCSCVPPGTSGNANVCPCYATMRTHGHRLKCP